MVSTPFISVNVTRRSYFMNLAFLYRNGSCCYISIILLSLFYLFICNKAIGDVYRMEFIYENNYGGEAIFMPLPKSWEGDNSSQVNIVKISPNPYYLLTDTNTGTQAVFWKNCIDNDVFKIIFDIQLTKIKYDLAVSQINSNYNKNSDIYKKNIKATSWAQSDNEQIIDAASSIVGNEVNPYKKAKLLFNWICDEIQHEFVSSDNENALTTLNEKKSACGGRANLFVAFCRALGIPARNITGFHAGTEKFPKNMILKDIYHNEKYWYCGHVWAEFYLPGYGWFQCDPYDKNNFGNINQERVITSKGNSIFLTYGNYTTQEMSWFHLPVIYGISLAAPNDNHILLKTDSPFLNISANGSDDPINISKNDYVSINININQGAQKVQNADWWIATKTPFGWYSYLDSTGWKPGIFPYRQGWISSLLSTEILNTSLPKGDYTFYLAMDDNMDGIPDATWYDSVLVNISDIIVDGKSDDWINISPVITDQANDSLNNIGGMVEPGTDIKDIYLARDSKYLYVRFDLEDGDPNPDVWYQINFWYGQGYSNHYDISMHFSGSWIAELRFWKNNVGGIDTLYDGPCEVGSKLLEGRIEIAKLGISANDPIKINAHIHSSTYKVERDITKDYNYSFGEIMDISNSVN
jgi:hypothetical protein